MATNIEGLISQSIALPSDRGTPTQFAIDLDDIDWARSQLPRGLQITGLYHSHPSTEPTPSPQDHRSAAAWPYSEWLILGPIANPDFAIKAYEVMNSSLIETPLWLPIGPYLDLAIGGARATQKS